MDEQAIIESLENGKNIPSQFLSIAEHFPDRVVYSHPAIDPVDDQAPRRVHAVPFRETAAQVCRLANYLIASGFKPGDKAAIISYTRPEWLIADLAILAAGGVSVAIYQSVSREETGYILYDSGTTWVFAENQEQIDKLSWLAKNSCPIPETEDRPATKVLLSELKLISFEAVTSEREVRSFSAVVNDQNLPANPPTTIAALEPEMLASLVYTSGTTGPPKGVSQTHRNHLANVWQATETKLFAPDGDIFLFLPLAHSFARLIGYIGFLTPTILRFPAVADSKSSVLNATSVLRDLQETSAQVVPSVPRILEKMAAGVKAKGLGRGIRARLVRATLHSAQRIFEAKRDGRAPGVWDQLLYNGTGAVRHKIKLKLFGPTFHHVVSGGAKLPIEVNEFFQSLGIMIYEGYGLTETCVATNVNRIGANKVGSVGPVVKKIQVMIASDGEICFKGPNITKGYYNRPKATAEAWDAEGWFHTGDLGRLDEDGYLYITGRKKELIVTSTGKKVAPQPIEDKLTASRYITTAVMFGDAKPYCSALVCLDEAAVLDFLSRHELPCSKPIAQNADVQKLISREIEKVNSGLSKHETIKTFRVMPEECTVENGLLTPTFKVKRKAVLSRYSALIDEMYPNTHS